MIWWIAVAAILVLIFVVAPLAFTFWQAQQLVHPRRKPLTAHPGEFGLEYEEVRVHSPDGNLAAWFLPGTNGRALIALHGINDNKQQWLTPASDLQRRGYNLLLLDFRGHGESEGRYVTYGDRETEDVQAALEYLQARGDVDMEHIGLMGLSLGAITAIIAAARLPQIKAVVAEAAMPDLVKDLALAFKRYTGLPAFPFAPLTVFWGQLIVGGKLSAQRPVEVIGKIAPRAVFIIGDLKDDLVLEPQASQLLFDRAGEPKLFWQVDAPHVGAYAANPVEYVDRLDAFFQQYL
jgi:pimeloyl-ACP methyl ester carboxylesterase